jgi:hypothetical protein
VAMLLARALFNKARGLPVAGPCGFGAFLLFGDEQNAQDEDQIER